MYLFLSGALMFASFVVATYFWKFWLRTQDALFAYFGAAFAVMGIERLVLGVMNLPENNTPLVYVLRLTAFALILIGIIVKNRR